MQWPRSLYRRDILWVNKPLGRPYNLSAPLGVNDGGIIAYPAYFVGV